MSKQPNTPVADASTPAPAATPAAPQTPAERKAAREAARTALRLTGALALNAAGRPDARGLLCGCGCEKPTHRDEALFLSGHDARMRAAVLALPSDQQRIEAIPFFTRAFFTAGPVAGLALEPETGRLIDVKRGGGF